MFGLLQLWLGVSLRTFRSRRSLVIENLALRQQLAVFKRQKPRPKLILTDKLFWIFLRRIWSSEKDTDRRVGGHCCALAPLCCAKIRPD